jgi:hypothetical protein
MARDDNEQLAAARQAYRRVQKHIERLTYQEKEDIAEQAIAEAFERIKERRRQKAMNPQKAVFTSFHRFNKTSVWFTMQSPESDFMLLRIKGGSHKVINVKMSRADMREFIFHALKSIGAGIYKRKNRGWLVYIRKR